jgi:protocatechuate 3,4-dioxygenase beta subunit
VRDFTEPGAPGANNMRRAFTLVILSLVLVGAEYQSLKSQAPRKGNGEVSGRVTEGGKPAAGIKVAAYLDAYTGARSIASAVTDQDGRYRLAQLPSGKVYVATIAPALVSTTENATFRPGKLVTLSDGEAVSDIDFTVTRGGIITGRVTDSEGKPVISEYISVVPSEENRPSNRAFNLIPFANQTDDRGIYRIFGLAPGKYYVSAGQSPERMMGQAGMVPYPLTFHPNVSDRSKAEVVEVTAGAEVKGVDIQFGIAGQGFTVSGRFIDAESGKPVPGLSVQLGLFTRENRYSGSQEAAITNAAGEFKIHAVMPGRYTVFAMNWGNRNSTTYSDSKTIEVLDADVSGLELKMKPGATVNGVVVLEDGSSADGLKGLSRLFVSAQPQSESPQNPFQSPSAPVGADGSFSLSGIKPGKVRLSIGTMRQGPQYEFRRLDLGGVEIPQATIDIQAGDSLSGYQMVVAYGNGSLRGTIKTDGVTLPQGAVTIVSCKRLGSESSARFGSSEVDSRGQFLIEGLVAGQYEVFAAVRSRVSPALRLEAKQTVSISDGVQAEVTLEIKPVP